MDVINFQKYKVCNMKILGKDSALPEDKSCLLIFQHKMV